MAIINKGTAFSNGEQLSASKLNDLVDGATFGTDSVDNSSTLLNGTGAITVRDSGITAAKLATNAVTTAKILNANVTKAKIENVADYKVLGNVSGAAAAPQEVAILDEDDMVSNSDTALATQQSIKAYVDSLSQYQMKYSGATGTFSTTAATFVDLDLSSIVGSNRALVILEVYDNSTSNNIFFRTKGSTLIPFATGNNAGWGSAATVLGTSDNGGTVVVVTDQSGIIQHRADTTSTGVKYTVQAYQKLS